MPVRGGIRQRCEKDMQRGIHSASTESRVTSATTAWRKERQSQVEYGREMSITGSMRLLYLVAVVSCRGAFEPRKTATMWWPAVDWEAIRVPSSVWDSGRGGSPV
jgi:hypothetical protein